MANSGYFWNKPKNYKPKREYTGTPYKTTPVGGVSRRTTTTGNVPDYMSRGGRVHSTPTVRPRRRRR